jgi:hypothetical protein
MEARDDIKSKTRKWGPGLRIGRRRDARDRGITVLNVQRVIHSIPGHDYPRSCEQRGKRSQLIITDIASLHDSDTDINGQFINLQMVN